MAPRTAKIAVILCTSRQPRANPQIANFVIETIKASYQQKAGPEPVLRIVDLAERNLPFLDEPGVPSQIHDSTQYAHAHTRAWSQEVQSYDAFIFVTPQYNWGYPAVLKNAIDYLFHEWKGKLAMIVSYGGHGGGKCNAQLRQVLCGVNMIPTKKGVELSFTDRAQTVQAATGKPLGLDGFSDKGVWADQRKQIVEAFGELMDLLSANKYGKMLKAAEVRFGLVKQEIRKRYRKPAEGKGA